MSAVHFQPKRGDFAPCGVRVIRLFPFEHERAASAKRWSGVTCKRCLKKRPDKP